MKALSIGVNISWQIAAAESAANHQFIEKEHIFIGILSLGKVAHAQSGRIWIKTTRPSGIAS